MIFDVYKIHSTFVLIIKGSTQIYFVYAKFYKNILWDQLKFWI